MIILGIETSCDETGIGLYDTNQGLIGHVLHSQIDLHADYGGVVPELASRDHSKRLLPLIERALTEFGVARSELAAIAYTAGPGLVGALMVGAAMAHGLALALSIPAVPVHHMEGHLLAPLLEEQAPDFPFVALLVSGGHTQLYQVTGLGQYSLLGQSLDDAAGEAFDKTAKLLGLPYPGGPALAKLAASGQTGHFNLPRPMTQKSGLDFSFSGLKTAVVHVLKRHDDIEPIKANLAADFQQAVVDTLLLKAKRALKQTKLTRLVVAGGVSANQCLRQALTAMAADNNMQVFYPRPEFCTDNGAMIAFAGALRLQARQYDDQQLTVKARWPMSELKGLD